MEAASIYDKTEYDIVICGAGLAGLAMARQISREIPDASLVLIEGPRDKNHASALRVGESTIEISTYYLADILGLRAYLETFQLPKLGLRFFFNGGQGSFQERPEFGLTKFSPITSFQLERSTLESALKQLLRDQGVPIIPNSRIKDILLAEDGGLHQVIFLSEGSQRPHTLQGRWVIDAMGRRRFLQKKLGIAEPANPHFSAGWFRLKGRIDVSDLVPVQEAQWHCRVNNDDRYYSTNHLMDNGRWVWLIPLATNATSIGIVTHEDYFPFTEYNTYDRALNWLRKHEPALSDLIAPAAQEPIDFQCMRHYSYHATRVFSSQRWACTGDAAVFSDPFVSPGIDQLGFANTIITNLIARDRAGTLQETTVDAFNKAFLNFNAGVSHLTHSGYPFFGKSLVMGTKLLWDFAIGFAVNGPQRFNRLYIDEQKIEALQPLLSVIFLLMDRMEQFFVDWGARTSEKYAYTFFDYLEAPGMREIYQRNLQSNKTLEDLLVDYQLTLEYLEELAQIIFLIALADTMPAMLRYFSTPLWLNAWGISLDPRRWRAEKLLAPSSKPRSLRYAEFASLFGVTQFALKG